jgi:uncharacterized LabA/DUF88 family protein
LAVRSLIDPGITAKAVEITLQMSHCTIMIWLMSDDSDFEPLLSYLRDNGRYIIVVGRKEFTSVELINARHRLMK